MSVSQKIVQLNRVKGGKNRSKPSFFQGMKEEMKKVSWTTKRELVLSAKIVIGAVFAFGIGIYIVDLVVRYLILGVGSFFK